MILDLVFKSFSITWMSECSPVIQSHQQ